MRNRINFVRIIGNIKTKRTIIINGKENRIILM